MPDPAFIPSVSSCRDDSRSNWPPPIAHERCDRACELLLFALIIFCPWAFGTTPTWAMHVANALGYTLGLGLFAKWIIRWRTGYRSQLRSDSAPVVWLTRTVALITLALLTQCFISALNARATYSYTTGTFDYHPCIAWLPHTYDSDSTWEACWNYLAWAAAFWSMRDWLLGRSKSDLPAPVQAALGPIHAVARPPKSPARLPARLQRLLWVLAINGALLGAESILQQTSGTNKLLWIRDTYYNRFADAQFGPFPYRSNGAQYVNLIWPATIGFWWALQRARFPRRATGHHALLACIVVMIASTTMTLSRGAVLVAAANVLAASALFLFAAGRSESIPSRLALLFLLCFGVAGGLYSVWDKFDARLKEIGEGFRVREQMTEVGRKMAVDAPVFGTGAETLQPLYQLYKGAADEYWPGQLHNDWLETRITFGLAGFGLILSGLILALIRWPLGGGIPVSWRFVSFVWLSMLGCLVHARWDLPFQVYSITHLFLLYCSMLLCFGIKSRS